MVPGQSPEWLPPGFTMKIKHTDWRKRKYYLHVATGKKYNSKNEVLRCATEYNNLLDTAHAKDVDDNEPSSIDKVDAISGKTNDSAANEPSSIDKVDAISGTTNDSASWLPNGWEVDEKARRKGSSQGSNYKVYTELSTGNKFYSKPAVTRYLKTIGKPDTATKLEKVNNVDGSVLAKSPQIISMKNIDQAHEQDSKENSPVKYFQKDEVGEPLPKIYPQVVSTSNSDGVVKTKKKGSSFVTVAIERTTADDLPSGWIKEVRTSKSGTKIRRDPYYTDPVSGYMFRSKPDVMRYLKTNDISSCAIKPVKREDEIISNENKTSSSNQAKEKVSTRKSKRFLAEELNGGGESSGAKNRPQLNTKNFKVKQVNHDGVKVTVVEALYPEEKPSCENSTKNAETDNNPVAENDVSKKDVMTVDVDMSSPVTDPTTNQQLPPSGSKNKVVSRRSKKRKDSSMRLRTSKRLAGCEPEMRSTLDLNERFLRAAFKGDSPAKKLDTSFCYWREDSDIAQTSNIEPAKEAVDHAVVSEETPDDVNQLKEDEKPPTEGTNGARASEKPLDDGQQSQRSHLCYDFGESWSDPLEFAFKTLRGELPLEDKLTFPSCIQETSFMNQGDECLKQPQADAPVNSQSEFPSHAEFSKPHNSVYPPPATSSSFSTLRNIGLNSCTGVEKNDSQARFNP